MQLSFLQYIQIIVKFQTIFLVLMWNLIILLTNWLIYYKVQWEKLHKLIILIMVPSLKLAYKKLCFKVNNLKKGLSNGLVIINIKCLNQ